MPEAPTVLNKMPAPQSARITCLMSTFLRLQPFIRACLWTAARCNERAGRTLEGRWSAGLAPYGAQLARTRRCSSDEHFALAAILSERRRFSELLARLLETAEPAKKVATDAGEQVVALEGWVGAQRVHQLEACSGPYRH